MHSSFYKSIFLKQAVVYDDSFVVTGQASELYDAMLQLKSLHATGHTGRETTEVGLRKQQRHLKDLGKLYVLFW